MEQAVTQDSASAKGVNGSARYGATLAGLWDHDGGIYHDLKSSFADIDIDLPDIDKMAKDAETQFGLYFVNGTDDLPGVVGELVRVPSSMTKEEARAFKAAKIAEFVAQRALKECNHRPGQDGDCVVPLEACELLQKIDSGETDIAKSSRNAVLGAVMLVPETSLRAFEAVISERKLSLDNRIVASAFRVPNVVAFMRLKFDREISLKG